MSSLKIAKLLEPYRIENGQSFRLTQVDPADTSGLSLDHEAAGGLLKECVERLTELQERLYAERRWAVLVIFQAMDAAGNDSIIKHVMSGINPQGCRVYSFRKPSEDELDHDYMWRYLSRIPERGHIGIFNRSYYEEVLVVRVERGLLSREHIPGALVGRNIWRQRYEDIVGTERYFARNGIAVCKFFLHVSKAEQRRRFVDRLNQPDKRWKFSPADLASRAHWDGYMRAYEEMIQGTATRESPWHVVPADNKWFTRLVVAAVLFEKLKSLDPHYPEPSAELKRQIKAAR
ncbi:MAG TPA: polyphosphate kinase 2 family protein, partial [Dongiaceae bacterium]|nr:polyphosphate kinase 2 family protein [Dongiaceae bacterium]